MARPHTRNVTCNSQRSHVWTASEHEHERSAQHSEKHVLTLHVTFRVCGRGIIINMNRIKVSELQNVIFSFFPEQKMYSSWSLENVIKKDLKIITLNNTK
uniref:Uncharacterized protein n=1 Tax=Cacopsylla melanoneura TaxID=428564 RepID=A0A8D8WT92_9HEMI